MRHKLFLGQDPFLLAVARFTPRKTYFLQRQRRWLDVRVVTLAGLLMAALLLAGPDQVRAHEGRPVGPALFVVGFQKEPAVEGEMNGVDLQVELPEGSTVAPELVDGLDATLKVEVTHLASDISTIMDLEPVAGEPGHYTANFIPTVPGEYRMRFFGTLGDMAVDENFESGHDTFSDVLDAADFHFPQPVPQAREFENAIRGAQESAASAQDSAATATLLAVAGLLLGAVGAIAGLLALLAVRRRP
jgi:hypothetical protein